MVHPIRMSLCGLAQFGEEQLLESAITEVRNAGQEEVDAQLLLRNTFRRALIRPQTSGQAAMPRDRRQLQKVETMAQMNDKRK